MHEEGQRRYGVFLTPDAKTSAAVTRVTSVVRAQFGLVSAHRFPPHVTLVGSLPLAATEDDLLGTVSGTVTAHHTFTVHNHGIERLGEAVVFDVHRDESGGPNTDLIELAADLASTVQPLLGLPAGLPADIRGRDSWRGHLSLASHELIDRSDLRDEVESFVRELDTPYPDTFLATTVTVYRLYHPSWTGSWWRTFDWEHLRSIRLSRTG